MTGGRRPRRLATTTLAGPTAATLALAALAAALAAAAAEPTAMPTAEPPPAPTVPFAAVARAEPAAAALALYPPPQPSPSPPPRCADRSRALERDRPVRAARARGDRCFLSALRDPRRVHGLIFAPGGLNRRWYRAPAWRIALRAAFRPHLGWEWRSHAAVGRIRPQRHGINP